MPELSSLHSAFQVSFLPLVWCKCLPPSLFGIPVYNYTQPTSASSLPFLLPLDFLFFLLVCLSLLSLHPNSHTLHLPPLPSFRPTVLLCMTMNNFFHGNRLFFSQPISSLLLLAYLHMSFHLSSFPHQQFLKSFLLSFLSSSSHHPLTRHFPADTDCRIFHAI